MKKRVSIFFEYGGELDAIFTLIEMKSGKSKSAFVENAVMGFVKKLDENDMLGNFFPSEAVTLLHEGKSFSEICSLLFENNGSVETKKKPAEEKTKKRDVEPRVQSQDADKKRSSSFVDTEKGKVGKVDAKTKKTPHQTVHKETADESLSGDDDVMFFKKVTGKQKSEGDAQ